MYIPPGFEKGLSLEGDDKKLIQQNSKTLNDQDESFLQVLFLYYHSYSSDTDKEP